MILHFLLLLAVGKLLMYFLRKFPPATTFAQKIRFPLDCDLCLGFWTYLILAPVFGIDVLDGAALRIAELKVGSWQIPVLPYFRELTTACTLSLLAHYIKIGWFDLHGVIEVKSSA